MSNIVQLLNRELIFINGKDCFNFLQGLVSNDVSNINDSKIIYSLMLNPQGRFLYEFFIFKYKDGFAIDVDANYTDEIIKKLSFYKLSSDIDLGKLDEFNIFFSDNYLENSNIDFNFTDPRQKDFGHRIYTKKSFNINKLNSRICDINFYNNLRIQNLIVDENDLEFNKSLIVEYGFDNFNAINYKKGCYVGQEVVARVHYKGTVRKKIFLVEIENMDKVKKYSEIACDNKNYGIILSSLFTDNKLKALALIKNIDNLGNAINFDVLDFKVNDHKIKIVK